MRTRRAFAMLATIATLTLFGVSAGAQQLPKSGQYTGKFLASETVLKVVQLEKDHSLIQTFAEGVFMNNLGEGFMHGAATACPIIGEVTKAGPVANGWCAMTDASGDKAFLAWKCGPHADGSPGCEGDFQWTGGTGKFVGMKGDNRFSSHPIPNTNQYIVDWKGEWRLP